MEKQPKASISLPHTSENQHIHNIHTTPTMAENTRMYNHTGSTTINAVSCISLLPLPFLNKYIHHQNREQCKASTGSFFKHNKLMLVTHLNALASYGFPLKFCQFFNRDLCCPFYYNQNGSGRHSGQLCEVSYDASAILIERPSGISLEKSKLIFPLRQITI